MADNLSQSLEEDRHSASTKMQLLAIVGLFWLSYKIFSFARLLASLFVLPGIRLTRFAKKGTWALVTGASDGIGKEYALQLAARGFNVVLVSRTKTKLDELAKTIESKYKVETKVLAMDFAADNDKDYKKLGALVEEVNEVSILINNVGLSHSIPVPFTETPDQEMRDIITVNCMGTLRVTALVAPAMVNRRHGLILTMASFGGILPTPLLATYSGSKAFLQQWSSALSAELASSHVHVQLVQSYLVTSAMSKIRRASWLIPTPRTFVAASLGKIGRSGGAQGVVGTSTPYWAHGIVHWLLSSIPGVFSGTVVNVNKGMHEDIRKRALRKAEREAKKGS